jgi:hypothetical protein
VTRHTKSLQVVGIVKRAAILYRYDMVGYLPYGDESLLLALLT